MNLIICPKCNTEIEIDKLLNKQFEDKIKIEYEKKLAEKKNEWHSQNEDFQKKLEEFENKKKNENKLFAEKIEKEKEKIKAEEKQKLEEKMKLDFLEKENFLKAQLESTKMENQGLKQKELALLKQQEDILTKEKEIELETRRRLMEERELLEKKIITQENQKHELNIKELEKKIEQMNKSLEEAQRKGNQGSQQLQGEVQEEALEELLKINFPFDEVEEVKKGIRGADCILHVYNNMGQNCGTITFESKRTVEFKNEWIEKLKQDQLNRKSDIAVLVSRILPKNITHFTEIQGVWVCTYNEVKPLITVLRHALIELHNSKALQINKGDKMTMLYDYITGNEFKMQLENIVEGFTQLQDQLNKEKRAMEKLWKEREKQIDKVIGNTIHIYGSVKGIAGNTIGNIKALELDTADDDYEILE